MGAGGKKLKSFSQGSGSQQVQDSRAPGFLEDIARNIREHNNAEEAQARLRKMQAGKEARRLARRFVKADPSLRKVVLFGSLLPGRRFRSDSDIDLGIVGGSYVTLLRIAEASSFPVDLVCMEMLSPTVRELMEREGLVLFDIEAKMPGTDSVQSMKKKAGLHDCGKEN
jgi:predicted nucleotidyltransferase